MSKSFRSILPAASSLLLILSFPNFNLWFLAWIGFLPLLFAIEGKKPIEAFRISYLTGAIFFIGTIYWLGHVTLPGMIIVALYLALYFGIFGLIACRGLHFDGYLSLVFIPAAWVTSEYMRAHFLTGFPWALLGHSQSYNLPVIQIADITGAYGVSFLIVMVNVSLYLMIKNYKKTESFMAFLFIITIAVFIVLYYGYLRLNNIFTGERLKVAVVQGNIPQDQKWDADFREKIIRKYEDLTRQAAAERPDLIVWPETSVPGFLEAEEDLGYRVKSLAAYASTPILVGTPAERAGSESYYNSAMLISGEGKYIGCYDKIHLVPFGEYIPFKKTFSFVEKFAKNPIGDFSSGKEYTVFNIYISRTRRDGGSIFRTVKRAGFSAMICFEDIFPDIARNFVKSGALFLINMTNDAWFGETNAPYQHAQSSVFRAVENRVNVVRAANTGLSCFIDQKGRIIGTVSDKGKELFKDGFKICEITVTKTKTFYNLYGDIFTYICIFITILCIFVSIPTGSYRGFYKR